MELIQYNVTVKSNLYAKYYFELRALFKDNEKEFPMKPLDKKDAENLELNHAKISCFQLEAKIIKINFKPLHQKDLIAHLQVWEVSQCGFENDLQIFKKFINYDQTIF